MAVTIDRVLPGSPAAKKGIEPGDRLISINGHVVEDVLDYRFYLQDERLSVVVQHGDKKRMLSLPGGETGMEFETYLMDRERSCRNRCVFCFIDQMPKGMRESLYFKDDDSRLSFLFGNYITLTNLTEHEVQRMIDMHISPVNVSVHTTNPDLRVKMMGNRFAGEALALLPRFAEAGLQINCQLVLCPGWNDGEELMRSLTDLSQLLPALQSVAAVPVGLTKYREGLCPLRLFTKEEAAAVIDIMEAVGDRLLRETGSRVVYPSDEFYLIAGRPLPPPAFYEEYAQLENGVGTLTLLREQFLDALVNFEGDASPGRTVVACGAAAAPFIRRLCEQAADKIPSLTVDVVAVRNDFFGETITVSGLVTGQDLIAQLQGVQAKQVLISDSMLRFEGDLFLDDVSLEQAEDRLGVRVIPVPADGAALFERLREG